jgi:hypothetical protein
VTLVDDITSVLSHHSPFDDPIARCDEVARLGVLILVGNIITTRFGGNDVAGSRMDHGSDHNPVSLDVMDWAR